MIALLAAALVTAAPSTVAIAAEVDCATRGAVDGAICLATFYAAEQNHPAAAAEFEKAAAAAQQLSAVAGDQKIARAFAAAGNMWIAAGQPGKAAFALDRALALPGLEAEQRGEALLDRARAAEAQGDLKTARTKLAEAAQSIPADPFYWYFSAALAVREGDKGMAQSAINKALSLAPNDATILFEAGHIADGLGNEVQARDYWTRAVAADPTGDSGKAAAKAIEMLGLTRQ